MNQHHIQEAYLKKFESSDRVWIYTRHSDKFDQKPASQCTSEEDFQSEYLEVFQNREIESPGIKKLRKLTTEHSLTEDELSQVLYWTALHSIRNKNFRTNSGLDYNSKFNELLETEKLFSNYYRVIFRYNCVENEEFFITSDNPIIEFTVGNCILRVLTLSPKMALLFSPIPDHPVHASISFPEMVNSMLYASCFDEIYSNTKDLQIDNYKNNMNLLNLYPVWENTEFTIK